jgi:hypothetical protein
MKIVTRALTVAEYRAKAALLGMWYGDRTNVFVQDKEDGFGQCFFDADTGEELDSTEVRRRMDVWRAENGLSPNGYVEGGYGKRKGKR